MEKVNIQLKEFLDGLSKEEAKTVRKLIAFKCKTNVRNIYNWTNVGIKIKPLYQTAIEEAVQQKIFH